MEETRATAGKKGRGEFRAKNLKTGFKKSEIKALLFTASQKKNPQHRVQKTSLQPENSKMGNKKGGETPLRRKLTSLRWDRRKDRHRMPRSIKGGDPEPTSVRKKIWVTRRQNGEELLPPGARRPLTDRGCVGINNGSSQVKTIRERGRPENLVLEGRKLKPRKSRLEKYP